MRHGSRQRKRKIMLLIEGRHRCERRAEQDCVPPLILVWGVKVFEIAALDLQGFTIEGNFSRNITTHAKQAGARSWI